jgi:uncharacterized membrane protein YfcA
VTYILNFITGIAAPIVSSLLGTGGCALIMPVIHFGFDFGPTRIAVIGTISRRMERVANSTALAQEARDLLKEVQLPESHLEDFEKYLKK